MDCSTGPLFFFHVNVSGGEFREVQYNVRGSPTLTVTIDSDEVYITGGPTVCTEMKHG